MDLVLKLRRNTKSSKSRSNKKIFGTSIEERPESVETREEFGHWEIDTVLGHKSKDQALLTLVERKTRSEEHTSELQSRGHLVCRLLLEKKKKKRDKRPDNTPKHTQPNT